MPATFVATEEDDYSIRSKKPLNWGFSFYVGCGIRFWVGRLKSANFGVKLAEKIVDRDTEIGYS